MKKLYLIIALCFPVTAQATDYYVGPGETYTTYAAWAAAVTEQDWDKVFLQKGHRYTEIFNISVNLIIDAYGTGARPIIDGEGVREHAFFLSGGKTAIISNIEAKASTGGLFSTDSVSDIYKLDNIYGHDNLANPCVTASGDGGYVKNSIFDGCANCAVYGNTASNWVIENSTITDTVTNDLVVFHDGTGSGNIVRGNFLSGAPENAVDIQAGYSDTIVENNTIEHTTLAPIGNGGTGTVIRENIIRDCARGIRTSQLTTIRNNYLSNLGDSTYGAVGDSEGIYLATTADGSLIQGNTVVTGAQVTGRAVIYAETAVDNLVIKNNILDTNKSQTTIYFVDLSPVGLESNYNIFQTTHSRLIQTGATIYETFAEWQTTGQDADSYYTDPYLDSQGRPTAKSPGNEAGAFLFTGQNYAGNYPAIGAYDYNKGTLMPWNIALSIPGGSTAIGGGGKTYIVPVWDDTLIWDDSDIWSDY